MSQSSKKILGRDQFNGNRLKFSDKSLSSLQIANRTANHLASAKSKACGRPAAKIENITVGTLVYIKHEGNKFSPRESYVVVDVKEDSVIVQKMNNGKFFSRQYTVPMSRVFPCVSLNLKETEEKATEDILSSSSDDDEGITTVPSAINQRSNLSDSSISSES